MSPLQILSLVVMLVGPLLQGLSGAADPNAYIFAPIIAVATLPLQQQRDLRGAMMLAVGFLAIGFGCLGLWWLGGRLSPVAVPGWAPLGVCVAGALLALIPRFTR